MYAWETYYYFQSHSGTSGLFLNCEGNGEIGDNQNVTIYKSNGDGKENKDHLFKLTRAYAVEGRDVVGCTIRSRLNPQYGLNIYGYGSSMTAEGNCDLYPVGGTRPTASNYIDSLIDLQTVDSEKMLYKITLIKHPGLYLTPVGQYNNANVRWVKSSKENAHIWKLCTSETIDSSGGSSSGTGDYKKEITMPYSYNQKDGPSVGFKNAGCACTCAMAVTSFYSGKKYSFDDFKPYYTDHSDAEKPYIYYTWKTPEGYTFSSDMTPSNLNEADTIAYIKKYIDKGIPPMCHCLPVNRSEHWVVAIAYNEGTGWDSLLVLDPYEGVPRSMKDAMEKSCGGTSGGVDRIMHHPNHSL